MEPSLSIPQAIELAISHHEAGQLDAAREIYHHVLRLHPHHPEALHLLGLVEHQSRRHEQAIELISKAIRATPHAAHFHVNLGEICRVAGRLDRAEAALREAIRLEPRSAPAHHNLGLVLQETGGVTEAIDHFRHAVRLDPRFLDAHLRLANALGQSNDLSGAYAAALEALRLHPNDARALTVAGTAAAKSGNPSHGADMLRAALRIDPSSAAAWTNLATALGDLGSHREALHAHRRAIQSAPDDPEPRRIMLMTLLRSDDQDAAAIANGHREWAKLFAASHERGAASVSTTPGKLRIGYVSGDFNAHPVPSFLIPLLAAHDRGVVQITCYSTADRHDAVTERCRSLCDRGRDIAGITDAQAAEQIRADGIDILVDLSGHSQGNRLQLFARRPAPVQVTYLGYAATTGLDAIDYRITDAICDPPGQTEHLHSERLLRVSAPFLAFEPPRDAPAVASLPLDSAAYVTFGSFNAAAKITQSTLAAWAKILLATPRSRLLIKGLTFGEQQTRALWLARFDERGISPDRIDFRAYASAADHLSMISQCDIALDTFPYCGTTTTCESLWMGVPVVSLAGNSHVSRVGLTLLSSVGLSDLAASTVQDYVATAAALAGDANRLRDIRARLRQTMSDSPLADGHRLARSIELAYRSICRRSV